VSIKKKSRDKMIRSDEIRSTGLQKGKGAGGGERETEQNKAREGRLIDEGVIKNTTNWSPP